VKTIYNKFSDNSRPELLDIKEAWYSSKHLPIADELEDDAFWYIRGMMNNDKLTWRIIIAILYFIGFSLITILLASNILYVVKASLR